MEEIRSSQVFQPYLLNGEHIVWQGRPKRGFLLGGRDALLIPFSLMWGGFAIFWNAMVWIEPFTKAPDASPDWFFRLWGLPFLAAGLYFIAGRFFHDAHIRKGLFYALTDQRILTMRGSKLTSLDIHRLPRLEWSQHRDGTGTLAFEGSNFSPFGSMNGLSWWLPVLGSGMQFYRIENSAAVYELVRNAAPC